MNTNVAEENGVYTFTDTTAYSGSKSTLYYGDVDLDGLSDFTITYEVEIDLQSENHNMWFYGN